MAAVELLTTNINVYEDRARHPEDAVQNDDEEQEEAFSCSRFLSVLGPGFMVCLADTDGPCLITAAASGAEYGYSLVLCQIVLIPILYAAQELTVRLSLTTRKGLTELIRIHFGPNWALFACVVLVITCVAAMISEISCIVQIGKLFDIPPIVSAVLVIIVLLAIVWSNRFREVEVIGVAMGSCQLLFLIVMFMVRPQVFGSGGLIYGLAEFHFDDSGWVQLLAANIGAVIMPWMLFYQQSASCERKLTPR
ncbi:unnamed protein product [Amoebophrya sp. A25]|nr:unnamed protein product [Amoebophrya sp. A25]|eukprot:GSA25T00012645001.1